MKLTSTLLGIVITILSIESAQAVPRGGSNQAIDFLDGYSERAGWSCGIYYHGRERDVEVLGGTTPALLEEDRVIGYVGYNPVPWLGIYGMAGWDRADLGSAFLADSEAQLIYGASLNFDLFSHEIQDPVLLEDKIRVNAGIGFFKTDVETHGKKEDLTEVEASLTVSVVNDVAGSKLYLPESIALFFGPIYSEFIGDDIEDSGDDQVGFTVGLEAFNVKRVSLSTRVEFFENTGYAVGLHTRF